MPVHPGTVFDALFIEQIGNSLRSIAPQFRPLEDLSDNLRFLIVYSKVIHGLFFLVKATARDKLISIWAEPAGEIALLC